MSTLKQPRAKRISLQVPVKLLDKGAKMPTKAYATDACFDLYTLKQIRIGGGGIEKIRTGVAFAIPAGYFGKVYERSGLSALKPFSIKAGVIDAGYTGEILVIVQNHGDYPEIIEAGTKLAQIAIHEVPAIELIEVETLPEAQRAENGFGSSDKQQ